MPGFLRKDRHPGIFFYWALKFKRYMLYSKDIIPVPGIQISIRMLNADGAFIAIENDDSPEVFSIFLPEESMYKFCEYINHATDLIKIRHGKEIH